MTSAPDTAIIAARCAAEQWQLGRCTPRRSSHADGNEAMGRLAPPDRPGRSDCQTRMTALKRHAYLLVALAVLAAATALRIADPGPLANLRRIVFDAYLVLSPREYDPTLPVRIIDIDEASLARVGQWPWPRTTVADLVERLGKGGAAAVALDFIFPERDRTSPAELLSRLPERPELAAARAEIAGLPSNDERLAEAIGQAPVVMGVLGSNEGGKTAEQPRASFAFAGPEPNDFVPHFADALQSLPELVAGASGLGAMNWVPDHDQVVRRLPVLVVIGRGGAGGSKSHGTLFPTLSVEALRIAQGAGTIIVKSAGASGVEAFGEKTGMDSVRVGRIILPTDAEGQVALKLTHSDRRRYISAYRVLDGTADAKLIDGHIVFIGASAPGLMDIRTTPLDRSIPGVEIHAQAVEQMLLNEHLVRPDYATGLELLLLLAAGGMLAWFLKRLGAVRGAAAGIAAVLAAATLSWFAYRNAGLLIDPVFPALSLAAIYSAGTLMRFQSTEMERAQIRAIFSRYMAPALVEQLAANPEKLKLGGELRELTLLFSDVRGFTHISEGLDAEALTRFVNQLFTPLSNVILENGGTIDKYMGDAVMAFWNAPIEQPDHARRAALSALSMLSALADLNSARAAEAAASGQPYRTVSIGIGLNTGVCCVGNFGTEKRQDYSCIGDDVNLASRLEGETKSYGASIIVGDRTMRAAPDLAYLPLGDVTVRGRSQPVAIYALAGDAGFAASPEFGALRQDYDSLRAAIARRDAAAATLALSRCRALHVPPLAGLWTRLSEQVGILAPTDTGTSGTA